MEIFKFCTLDNPVFVSALFWIALFFVTGAFTIHYKIQEAQEEALKEAEKLAQSNGEELVKPIEVKQKKQIDAKPAKTEPKKAGKVLKPVEVVEVATPVKTDKKKKVKTPKKVETVPEPVV